MQLMRLCCRTSLVIRNHSKPSSKNLSSFSSLLHSKIVFYQLPSICNAAGIHTAHTIKPIVMRSISSSKIDDLLNDPARNLNHEAMMRRKKDGPLLLIDVREPAELAETGVVPDSINVPLKNVEDALGPMTPEAFRQTYGAEKPTKGTLIVFSCRSGKRSRAALAKALTLGYLNSSHYEGGWLEWEKHLNRNC